MRKTKQRKSIFLCFDKNKTPTEIREITNLALSHISRTLKDFVSLGLIICLNPNDKMGRIYELTKLGNKIYKKI